MVNLSANTLPNQFYESLAGLSSAGVVAVVTGVRRSGTTATWQILRGLWPNGVVKTHSWLDVSPDTPVVANHRDFRECVVSWWRLTALDHATRNAAVLAAELGFLQADTLAVASSTEPITAERAVEIVGLIKRDVWHLDQWRSRHKKLLLVPYRLMADPQQFADTLSSFLTRDITIWDIYPHSHEANRWMRAYGAHAFDYPDEGQTLHCDPSPVPWRDRCGPGVADLIESLLYDELSRYRYLE